MIQYIGGTSRSIAKGKEIVRAMKKRISQDVPRVAMSLANLTIGCECGGSDGTSGRAGNPVVGRFFDQLVDAGGSAIFEKVVEQIRLKKVLLQRAANDEACQQLEATYDKAEAYCKSVRRWSTSPGNLAGGVTTIEEKSLGAFAKSGSRPIQGVIRVSERPPRSGLWLMDSVPDGHFMRFGYTNPNDSEGIMDWAVSSGVASCWLAFFQMRVALSSSSNSAMPK